MMFDIPFWQILAAIVALLALACAILLWRMGKALRVTDRGDDAA